MHSALTLLSGTLPEYRVSDPLPGPWGYLGGTRRAPPSPSPWGNSFSTPLRSAETALPHVEGQDKSRETQASFGSLASPLVHYCQLAPLLSCYGLYSPEIKAVPSSLCLQLHASYEPFMAQ